jgi:hypothetical protein
MTARVAWSACICASHTSRFHALDSPRVRRLFCLLSLKCEFVFIFSRRKKGPTRLNVRPRRMVLLSLYSESCIACHCADFAFNNPHWHFAECCTIPQSNPPSIFAHRDGNQVSGIVSMTSRARCDYAQHSSVIRGLPQSLSRWSCGWRNLYAGSDFQASVRACNLSICRNRYSYTL